MADMPTVNSQSDSSGTPKPSKRGLVRMLSGFLLLLVAPALLLNSFIQFSMSSSAGKNQYYPSVEVYDETAIFSNIRGQSLQDALGEVAFRQPVKLVILSTDDLTDNNLNEATLNYARNKHTEWLSADRNKWADGLVILSVSPSYRKVGTYFGENTKVSSSKQDKIQEAAKSDFRAEQWSEGMLEAAREAAEHVPDANGNGSADFTLPSATSLWSSFFGLVLLWRGLSLRRKARRNIREAREHWEHVEADKNRTERAFTFLGETGKYGDQLGLRYAEYQANYRIVQDLWNEIGTPKFFDYFSTVLKTKTDSLIELTSSMDSTDDTIFAASEFFNLGGGWVEAWMKEIGPVIEDLTALGSLVDDVSEEMGTPDAMRGREEILRWTAEQQTLIASLKDRIGQGKLTPVAALEELDRIADETRNWVKGVVVASLKADTSKLGQERYERWEEAQEDDASAQDAGYEGEYRLGGVLHKYDPASTIRLNTQSAGVNPETLKAIGFGSYSYPGWDSNTRIYHSMWFEQSRYMTAHQWTRDSGDTNSSSYGSSGGSFSGSGSSSSF